MKIKRIQFDRYGEASEMYMGDYELPQLKSNEVKIKVRAAAINPLDWKQRKGALKLFMSNRFPKGIGNDFSGIVEAVGKEVNNVRIGDEVFGTMDVKHPGAFAEALITPAGYISKKPSQISFSEASCLPIPCATAWAALFIKGNISKRSRVLINGCMGAVGAMAVQLARSKGAFVAGTCSENDMERAKDLGLNAVFNYADKNYWKNIKPFDLVFDTSGLMEPAIGFSMLNPKGKFVDINPTPKRMLRGLFSGKYRMTFATAGMSHLTEFADIAVKESLKAGIAKEIGFSEAIDIITKIEKGEKVKGRVVIRF
ncbi:NADP-dependent oxidoreductase [Chitinophaga tropicalis]|uniref:NADP-dependent oxidoreductase n=1 Tax=Chitinophaga tropicalis TaxID=2683588 RepID=UPI0018DF4D25|nr:NADP-dependent oxidoreductase [Chitinophaga tropicalis]